MKHFSAWTGAYKANLRRGKASTSKHGFNGGRPNATTLCVRDREQLLSPALPSIGILQVAEMVSN